MNYKLPMCPIALACCGLLPAQAQRVSIDAALHTADKPYIQVGIVGYLATNVVEVTLDDLAQVSKVIDTATQSGANIVRNLQYRLKNPRSVRGQALREAAEQARASAEAMASGLGLRIVRVISAEEMTAADEEFGAYKKTPPPPAPGQTPETPLEIGMVEVSATVILRVEIGE